jgi:hypothetical protein
LGFLSGFHCWKANWGLKLSRLNTKAKPVLSGWDWTITRSDNKKRRKARCRILPSKLSILDYFLSQSRCLQQLFSSVQSLVFVDSRHMAYGTNRFGDKYKSQDKRKAELWRRNCCLCQSTKRRQNQY